MGVADNRSYKDEYLFRDDKYDVTKSQPSIEVDPKINSTIKENPYRSNVEIEGGEIVLQPDLSALFKAKGAKHSRGGMDVLLKPDSFVFSDFKGLEIDKKERELFELKEGGKSNTPAEVLKKNVDPKHYNTLVNIMEDPYKDDLAKKSAALMLEKYLQGLGNIAFIQENKKGFPQGVPEFAANTAPVYNPELKHEIEENKQYMKAGGTTNPYMQAGGPKYSAETDLVKKLLQRIGLKDIPKKDILKFIPPIYSEARRNPVPFDPIAPPNRAIGSLPYMEQYNPIDNTSIVNANLEKAKAQWEAQVELQRQRALVKKIGTGAPKPKVATTPNVGMSPALIALMTEDIGNLGIEGANAGIKDGKPTPPDPKVKDLNVTPQGSKQADWRFTPWQKLSHLNNLMQYANVKKYMPYRSRYNATYVDPALVNPEQAIGDVKGMAHQQLSSISTLNPILRNAQAASISGQVMNQVPGIRSQYDNQNAQILNQTRQYNNQVKNNESMINMGNDQTYYTQAVEGRKNFDNMRSNTWNQYMNNLLGDVKSNQTLAYNLLTQDNPAYAFDWATGSATRTNKSIMDVQAASAKGDDIETYAKDLIDNYGISPEKAFQIASGIAKIKVVGKLTQPSIFKKGGKTKKNPY